MKTVWYTRKRAVPMKLAIDSAIDPNASESTWTPLNRRRVRGALRSCWRFIAGSPSGGLHTGARPLALAPVGAEHPVDHVVDGDGAEQAPGRIAHRHGEQVVARERHGHLTIGGLGCDDGNVVEELAQFHRRWFAQQALHVNH